MLVCCSVLTSQYSLLQLAITLRVKSALTSAIYAKYFKLSNTARRERSIGESVNLIQIDSQNLQDLIQNFNLVWSCPLTIVLSLYSLWGLLGPSSMAGLAVMCLLTPINTFLRRKMKVFSKKNMKLKDTRIKIMNEILDGMKVLKLYAWEKSFQEKVENIRKKEVKNLKKYMYFFGVQKFVFNSIPYFVAIVTFATFVLVDSNNKLNAKTAFVALSYFNIMRSAIKKLPALIRKGNGSKMLSMIYVDIHLYFRLHFYM